MNYEQTNVKHALINKAGKIIIEFGSEDVMNDYIKRQRERYGSEPAGIPAKIEIQTTITIM